MRNLSINECADISGGSTGTSIMIGAAAVAGGYIAYNFMNFLGPVSTVLGTLGGTMGGGFIGTLAAPGPGTILGAAVGGVGGYFLSSSLANAGGFLLGAAAGGAGAAYLLLA